jgi:hypothetical protein
MKNKFLETLKVIALTTILVLVGFYFHSILPPMAVEATPFYVSDPGRLDLAEDYTIIGNSLGKGAATSPSATRTALKIVEDWTCVSWEDPVAADDFESIKRALTYPFLITYVWCESDATTLTIDLYNDGQADDVIGTNLDCSSTSTDDACASGCYTTISGSPLFAVGENVDIIVGSVTGGTYVTICFESKRQDP